MPTTSSVASKLRQLADALDKTPDLEVSPYLAITIDAKEDFFSVAKNFPRPAKKKVDFEGTNYSDFTLVHEWMRIKILQKEVCVLVEPARPARYECSSILSVEEEAALNIF